MSFKLKLLTCWVIILILQNIVDDTIRMTGIFLQLRPNKEINKGWDKDLAQYSRSFFNPIANFSEIFTYCMMLIAVAQ